MNRLRSPKQSPSREPISWLHGTRRKYPALVWPIIHITPAKQRCGRARDLAKFGSLQPNDVPANLFSCGETTNRVIPDQPSLTQSNYLKTLPNKKQPRWLSNLSAKALVVLSVYF